MVVLSIFTELAIEAIKRGAPLVLPHLPLEQIASRYPALNTLWSGIGGPITMFVLPALFWIGAMFAILRSFEAQGPLRVAAKVLALWAALFVAKNALPHSPVFAGPNFDPRNANLWEYVRARQMADADRGGRAADTRHDPAEPGLKLGAARAGQSQPALLKAALDQLAPQRPGTTDVYAIGLAGWAEQDVFIKELDGALEAIARVLPTDNRVLRLVNHPDTVLRTPIVTRQNFAAAVRSVARAMDKDEDVLLLFMTSHGSSRGVALRFSSLAHGTLSPDDIAAVLEQEGIKHRMLIVSACYSGVFAKPPLADDNTIILTAADENSPSFGCSNERDWTYFGDALFNRGLTAGKDLEHAFQVARDTIANWEARDNLARSNPQGHFGAALIRRLAPIYRRAMRAETESAPDEK
jgi:hypothetical protein